MTTAAKPVLGPWEQQANCLGVDPDLFFPAPHASPAPAKAVCQACPVRVPCLEYALNEPVQHGIWGGLTAAERRRLRAPRRPAATTRRLRLVPA